MPSPSQRNHSQFSHTHKTTHLRRAINNNLLKWQGFLHQWDLVQGRWETVHHHLWDSVALVDRMVWVHRRWVKVRFVQKFITLLLCDYCRFFLCWVGMVVWFDINLSDIELDGVCVRLVLSWVMLKEDSVNNNEPINEPMTRICNGCLLIAICFSLQLNTF